MIMLTARRSVLFPSRNCATDSIVPLNHALTRTHVELVQMCEGRESYMPNITAPSGGWWWFVYSDLHSIYSHTPARSHVNYLIASRISCTSVSLVCIHFNLCWYLSRSLLHTMFSLCFNYIFVNSMNRCVWNTSEYLSRPSYEWRNKMSAHRCASESECVCAHHLQQQQRSRFGI